MNEPIVVCGIGMVTSVGITALQTYFCVRAGATHICTTDFHDKIFQPFVMAALPDECLPEIAYDEEHPMGFSKGTERILCLGVGAIEDLLNSPPPLTFTQNIPLFLGWKEKNENPAGIIKILREHTPLKIDPAKSYFYPFGRAAGLFALKDAWNTLIDGDEKMVLVAGCDSYKDLHRLGYLDKESRIKSALNADGFIPGEGACFLLLALESTADQYGLKKSARLTRLEMGFETGHLTSELPYKGEGLSYCLGNLLSESMNEPIRHVFSSMNGESHWGKEWGVSYIRNSSAISDQYEMHHPAEFFGDLGAGMGTTLVGVASLGYTLGHLNGTSLVYASSDNGERVALLMEGI